MSLCQNVNIYINNNHFFRFVKPDSKKNKEIIEKKVIA